MSEEIGIGKEVKQEKSIIRDFLFGLYFLIWTGIMIYFVSVIGFIQMFVIMSIISAIMLIVLARK